MTHTNVVLSPEDRARLREGVDPDALERFLRAIPAAERDGMLPYFVRPSENPGPRHPYYVDTSSEPDLHRLHAAVWAPLRERLAKDPTFWAGVAVSDRRAAQVHVALVDRLEDRSAAAAIIRRIDPEPRELILLPKDSASAPTLVAAVLRLQSQRRFPIEATGKVHVHYVLDASVVDTMPNEVRTSFEMKFAEIEQRLAALRNTPQEHVAGIGDALVMVLDPNEGRRVTLPVWDPRCPLG